jgi:hypothetical protein
MATTITDYCNLEERLAELGLVFPTEIALLPHNLESAKPKEELLLASTAATLRKLWKQAGIVETSVELSGKKLAELKQNDFSLLLPAMFVSYSVWSQNPALLNIAFGVVSNYATDFFKGMVGRRKVKFDIIIERVKGKEFKRIRFEGEPDELKDLPKIIRELNKNAA